MALNVRQQRFVDGIIAGKSATEAYRDAGYHAKGHATEANASRMLRNAEVAASIDSRRAKVADEVDISAASILERLNEVANRCLMRAPAMEFLPSARCMVQRTAEDGTLLYEFDSSGACRALELLGKWRKLWTDKVVFDAGDGLADMLAKARARRLRERASEPNADAQANDRGAGVA